MYQAPTTILRLPEVLKMIGVSRSTVYKWMEEEDFPPRIKLGPRAIGWDSKKIETWILARDERETSV